MCRLQFARTSPHSASYKDGGLPRTPWRQPYPVPTAAATPGPGSCILLLTGVGGEESMGTCSDSVSRLFPRALPCCYHQKPSTPKPVISIKKDSQVTKITTDLTH